MRQADDAGQAVIVLLPAIVRGCNVRPLKIGLDLIAPLGENRFNFVGGLSYFITGNGGVWFWLKYDFRKANLSKTRFAVLSARFKRKTSSKRSRDTLST